VNCAALAQFRTHDDATAALALDGITCRDVQMRVRRPKDYVPPNKDGTFTTGGLSNQVPDGPDKIWIGGLPYYFNEEQVIELLSAFGELKAFHLARDGMGKSRGYAFCEYLDHNLTDLACAGLNGMEVGGRSLTVQRSMIGKKDRQGMPGFGFDGGMGMGLAGTAQFPALGGVTETGVPVPVLGPILPPPPTAAGSTRTTYAAGAGASGTGGGYDDRRGRDERDVGYDRDAFGADDRDGGRYGERGGYGSRGSYGPRGGYGRDEPASGGGPPGFVRAGNLSSAPMPVGDPTHVLQLLNMVVPEELMDDEEYNGTGADFQETLSLNLRWRSCIWATAAACARTEILEDVRDECNKFGPVREVVIPRPTPDGQRGPGVGKVGLCRTGGASCVADR